MGCTCYFPVRLVCPCSLTTNYWEATVEEKQKLTRSLKAYPKVFSILLFNFLKINTFCFLCWFLKQFLTIGWKKNKKSKEIRRHLVQSRDHWLMLSTDTNISPWYDGFFVSKLIHYSSNYPHFDLKTEIFGNKNVWNQNTCLCFFDSVLDVSFVWRINRFLVLKETAGNKVVTPVQSSCTQ